MIKSSQEIVGIVASNSCDYVRNVFDQFSQNNVVVPLRSEDDYERKEIIQVNRVIIPEHVYGWCQFYLKENDSDDIALISFTSGTIVLSDGSISQSNAIELFNSTRSLILSATSDGYTFTILIIGLSII